MYKSLLNFRLALIALLAMLALPLQQISAQDDTGDTQTLQEYIDGLKFGIDDYAYGTAPGFVGDEKVYSDFFNTFVEATTMASAGTATAEEQTAMIAKLKAAIAKADSALVPVTDGVYYIHTGYSVFKDKPTMSWYAPRTGNYAGWKQ